MPKEIEPKLKLISTYLSSQELFVIPEYQRSYSWTVTECDKLWQDVETFMETGESEPYFFGTIIADCAEHDKISLIDGQQRTTTFIILLKALLLRMKEKLDTISGDEDARRIKSALEGRRNRILDILFKTNDDTRLDILEDWNAARGKIILENDSINEIEDYKRELQIIVDAESFDEAEGRCHKIPRKQKDNKYTNFFRNFKFFYSKLGEYDSTRINLFAKTFLSECQVIEIRSWNTEQAITMFNSLNSTGMPLSDSDIISAKLYAKAGADKVPFIAQWENIKKIVHGLETTRIGSIDSLLQQYMYIRRAIDREYVREGAQPDVTTPGLRKYYTSDKKHLLDAPLVFCSAIEKLGLLWERIRNIPAVKLLLKFNENAKLYLISYLNRFSPSELDDRDVVPIAECLVRLFAVLEIVDAGYSSSKFKTFLFGENVKLVSSSVSTTEIQTDFDTHISRCWTREDIHLWLEEYDKNILVFLNEYIYAKEKGLAFDFSESVNIEHIMPGSGHNIDTIRQDAGIDTIEDFKTIVNRLGNKILLEEDINKSIGNDWFRTKKQTSVRVKKGYKDSKYPLASALVSYPNDFWTKADIKNATEKACCRIANFIFGTR